MSNIFNNNAWLKIVIKLGVLFCGLSGKEKNESENGDLRLISHAYLPGPLSELWFLQP